MTPEDKDTTERVWASIGTVTLFITAGFVCFDGTRAIASAIVFAASLWAYHNRV